MTHDHFHGCLRFSFAELKKPPIYIFFRNLHLLTFSNNIWFSVFSFKTARIRIFSPRTPAKVRSNLKEKSGKIEISAALTRSIKFQPLIQRNYIPVQQALTWWQYQTLLGTLMVQAKSFCNWSISWQLIIKL